ncbi:FtsK/SpoIIIE domain-containing protein [Arsenicicoccus cauae]|uniref:FtsK/SpoIIIE domain-containing protein n=1 Tax=Arsenicicoccus cauae TaxID=2663847 RepID=UPI0018A6E6C3|nr:FtsK/SpoIIIE domain-containing protein [Arsenicicoccus cauae]
MRVELTVESAGGRSVVAVTAPTGTPWSVARPLVEQTVGTTSQAVWRLGPAVIPDGATLGRPPLVRGAHIHDGGEAGDAVPPDGPASALHLATIGGPDAGRVLPLRPGRHVVGRDPGCDIVIRDPELSRHHGLLMVDDDGVVLADTGSTNGTRADGHPVEGPARLAVGTRVRLGGTVVAVRRSGRRQRVDPDGEGHLVVHPHPVGAPRAEDVLLDRPREPTPPDPRAFPWLTLLLPLLASGVLAWVMHSPYLLLFGLLGPVMVLASHLSDRSARGRRARELHASHLAAVADVDRRLAEALADERARRERASRDPATVLQVARLEEPGLWSRVPDRTRPLTVRLGRARLAARAGVRDPDGVVHRPLLDDVPVDVDLAEARLLGLAGPGATEVARAVVAALAVECPPGELTVDVIVGSARQARAWEWTRWLPHRSRPAASPLPVAGSGAAAQVIDDLRADGGGPAESRARTDGAHPPWRLAVVAGLDALGATEQLGGLLSHGDQGTVLVVTVAEEPDRVPVSAGAWLRIAPGGRATAGMPEGELVTDVVPDAVGPDVAEQVARALAPLRAPAGQGVGVTPDLVTLADVSPVHLDSPADVAAGWARPTRGPSAPLGLSAAGPVTVDLVADGPHVLVGGTTGAGKSELLQTLVAGLALALPPDELTFVLVDYKGGAAFAECASLPHSAGVVTDLDPHLARRVLRSLRAELTRRERALRTVGAPDLDAYGRLRRPGDPLVPRLVIVVDEFRVLAQELPDFVPGLLTVATIGRSLGVHLVLATQRPAGVVTPDIRANVNARVALRMRDRADSEDVIEAPDAARISDRLPGRALWRTGEGNLHSFQTAWAGAPAQVTAGEVTVELADGRRVSSARTGSVTQLASLVRATREAAAGRPLPASPWLPPLPDLLRPAELADPDLAGTEPMSTELPLGLVELPDAQVRLPLRHDLAAGRHLAVVGTHRTGRTSALRALAAAAAARHDPDSLHLHVVDGDGGLGDLEALPHCGTRVTRADPARVLRLLELLAAGMAHARPTGTTGPTVLVLVDRWDAVVAGADPVTAAALQDALTGLLRDGPGAGLVMALAGDRSLLTSSIATHLGERLLLRLADATDLALCGVPASARPEHQPAGRALRASDHAEIQLVLVEPEDVLRVADDAPSARRRPPLTLRPLPSSVTSDAVRHADPRAFGVGGDQAGPVSLDLAARPVVTVCGPPGSGRSTALVALAQACGRPADRVVVVAAGPSPAAAWADAHSRTTIAAPGPVVPVLGPTDDEALRRHLDQHPDAVVLVDDLEHLLDSPVEQVLVALARHAVTHPGGPVLVASGTTQHLAATYRGLATELRRAATGLVLQPRHASEGDLLGVALPRLHAPPPGRGVLVDRGRTLVVQVALPRAPADRGTIVG